MECHCSSMPPRPLNATQPTLAARPWQRRWFRDCLGHCDHSCYTCVCWKKIVTHAYIRTGVKIRFACSLSCQGGSSFIFRACWKEDSGCFRHLRPRRSARRMQLQHAPDCPYRSHSQSCGSSACVEVDRNHTIIYSRLPSRASLLASSQQSLGS